MAFFRGLAAVSRLRSRMGQDATTLGGVRWLQMQSASDLDLRSQLQEMIPEQQDRLKKLKSEHGKVQLGNITVDMVLGGMRGMTGMLWETSLLDPEEGIRFRGLSIPECQKVLLAAVKDGEPLPEGLLWLLLTGKVPTKEQVDALSKELLSRSTVPGYVYKAIDALPVTAHPMTQFTTGVMALQVESEFQKAYDKGMPKTKFWEPTYEDCLNLIARLPQVASYVYRRIFKDGKAIAADNTLDYAANFSHMLGFDDPKMLELMRLYITIHTDHEGGNVSAHTGHLVGSALSDPYLSFAAALNGLAGPLHGLANQEVTPNIYLLLQKSGWWQEYRCSLSDKMAMQRQYYCMQMGKLPVSSFECIPFSNSVMERELCMADINIGGAIKLVLATSHLESPCAWNQMYSKERVTQANASMRILDKFRNVIFCGEKA